MLGIGGSLLLSAAFLRRIDADHANRGRYHRRRFVAAHRAHRLRRRPRPLVGYAQCHARSHHWTDGRDLRQVSNDIAHDLRSPLTRLRQDLEEAQKRDLPAADLKRVIRGAMGEADVLLETFSALLRIAQIEAGTRRSACRNVDLCQRLFMRKPMRRKSRRAGRRRSYPRSRMRCRLAATAGCCRSSSGTVELALHHTGPGTAITLRLARATRRCRRRGRGYRPRHSAGRGAPRCSATSTGPPPV